MDIVYGDYANWKLEFEDLINALIDSKIAVRFKHIYDVVECIYDKAVKHDVSEEEEQIFQYGYDYLYDKFSMLSMILKENYDDVEDLKKDFKNINLLFYLMDFEREAEVLEKETKAFQDLEQKVYDYIKKHENVPDELYGLMNDLSFKTFSDIEYKGVVEIFLEIADEMGINYLEDSVYSL